MTLVIAFVLIADVGYFITRIQKNVQLRRNRALGETGEFVLTGTPLQLTWRVLLRRPKDR